MYDRRRVAADLACVIADGARAISDFRVMGDQRELFGPVASVPTAWRTLTEIADGGTRTANKITAAVSTARRHAWDQIIARHGTLPGVRIADKTLDGVICVRIDATVAAAHSDKEWAEPNFKGFGHHPLQAYCDNARCAHARCWIEEAHVAELTGLLRRAPGGDQLASWPDTMRAFVRRERPHPGAQLSLFETPDGWRYTLWVTNRAMTAWGWLGQPQYIDAAHRIHARVEDCIRTGKKTGLAPAPCPGRRPGQGRAQDTALSDPARSGPARPRRPPTKTESSSCWPWATRIEYAWQRITALPQAP